MNIKDLQDTARQFVEQNATTLLTAGGVVGTVVTGVLAWRGGYSTAYKVIAEEDHRRVDEFEHIEGGVLKDAKEYKPLNKWEKVVLAAPASAPAVGVGGLTITAIIFSHRMSAQKAAAMAALYGLSQNQFEEYKAKVAEKLTGSKNQAITDELAQDRVNRAPGSEKLVIIEGTDVLAFDEPTGRYFKSSMEEINSAVNKVNQSIIAHGCARAEEYYDKIGLPPTTWASDVGWSMDNMLELDITTTQAPDGRPCLSINFVRFPIEDYHRHH